MNIGFTKNLPDSKSPGIVQRRMRLCTRLSAMYRLHEYVRKHQRQDAKHDAQHASATVFPALIQSMHMTPKVCPRAWFVSRFLYICSPLNSLNPEASIANEPARERKDDLDVVAGKRDQLLGKIQESDGADSTLRSLVLRGTRILFWLKFKLLLTFF